MKKFLKFVFGQFIKEFQAPSTQAGKSLRDGLFAGMAWLIVILLESVNNFDFGNYEFFAGAFLTGLIAKINRESRLIKREKE